MGGVFSFCFGVGFQVMEEEGKVGKGKRREMG
jgi:hypothetical protein